MKAYKNILVAVALVSVVTSLPVLAVADTDKSCAGKSGKDIVQTAVAAEQFQTLVAAVQAAGLVETLQGEGPFTVFAPTDEAFGKLPEGTVQTLLKPENKAKLASILKYHVVPGRVPAADVVQAGVLNTVEGPSILVSAADGVVRVDGAQVVKADVEASNGVIHVIDEVIMPKDIVQTARTAGTFNTLLAAAGAAGLVEALSDPSAELTVFAPTDAAFEKLPEGTVETLLKPENRSKLAAILKYHVLGREVPLRSGTGKTLQGGDVPIRYEGPIRVGGANVVAADIRATNGVVHVIDTVLLPPDKQTAAADEHGNAADRRRVRGMIERAINQGAPVFNAGHHGRCAEIYMKTARTLLAEEASPLCEASRQRLRKAMHQARRHERSVDQAWALRHALDSVHKAMAGPGQ
jgi:uncharacterized surface protein with fasciclin (FAS1) repeats